MLHVRASSSLYGIEVAVDDSIQVFSDDLRHLMKFIVVKSLGLLVDILGKGDGCEIANRSLILVRILQDLCAQVGTLDDTQILLVTLGVACILVKHVRSTCLGLRLEDSLPYVSRWYGGVSSTLFFVLEVKLLKLLTIRIGETRSFVRAKERPITTLLDTLHEQIWNP